MRVGAGLCSVDKASKSSQATDGRSCVNTCRCWLCSVDKASNSCQPLDEGSSLKGAGLILSLIFANNFPVGYNIEAWIDRLIHVC